MMAQPLTAIALPSPCICQADHPCGKELGRAFDALYVELVDEATCPLFDGIEAMLRGLKKECPGVVFGALSNACGRYVRAVLAANGIADLFEASTPLLPLPCPAFDLHTPVRVT